MHARWINKSLFSILKRQIRCEDTGKAWKLLNHYFGSQIDERQALHELTAGAVIQPPHVCWLVCEYLPGGTLAEWLYGKNGKGASRRNINEKLAMCVGVAQGMLVSPSF